MPRKKKVVASDTVIEVQKTPTGLVQDQSEVAQKPSVGRIVHYVNKKGIHRPAIIVEVWSDEVVNLQVFTDMRNDGELQPVLWATSVPYSSNMNLALAWHWPEYVK